MTGWEPHGMGNSLMCRYPPTHSHPPRLLDTRLYISLYMLYRVNSPMLPQIGWVGLKMPAPPELMAPPG
jgi:hypothetical protein